MSAKKYKTKRKPLLRELKSTWPLYAMFALPAIWFLIFSYVPMVGIFMAFSEFEPGSGILGFFTGEWVGLKHFVRFFSSYYAWRIIRNTVAISFLDILVNFFSPILLALMFNEIINKTFKKVAQSITYLPKFISMVVIVSILRQLLGYTDGMFNNIIEAFGGKRIYFLSEPKYFWAIFTLMNTWATIGWSSIVYVSAISALPPDLYEACKMDGGGRFRMMWNVTLPGIRNTIMIMFILRMGTILTVGLEPILLLSSTILYDRAEVLSLHIYNYGMKDMDYSYAAAVGLLQSVFGLIMVLITNAISRKVANYGLW